MGCTESPGGAFGAAHGGHTGQKRSSHIPTALSFIMETWLQPFVHGHNPEVVGKT